MAMEGSDYGSAHLPSPALVVFSQAANGLSEALRIQRPFHSQVGKQNNELKKKESFLETKQICKNKTI